MEAEARRDEALVRRFRAEAREPEPPGVGNVYERWAMLLKQQLCLANAQQLEDEKLRKLLVVENQTLHQRIFVLEGAVHGGSTQYFPPGQPAGWRSCDGGRDPSSFADAWSSYGGGSAPSQTAAAYPDHHLSGVDDFRVNPSLPNMFHHQLAPRALLAACRAGQGLTGALALTSARAVATAQQTSPVLAVPISVPVCALGAVAGGAALAPKTRRKRKATAAAMGEIVPAVATFALGAPIGSGMMPAAEPMNVAAWNRALGQRIGPANVPAVGLNAACEGAVGKCVVIGIPGRMHEPAAPAPAPADSTACALGLDLAV